MVEKFICIKDNSVDNFLSFYRPLKSIVHKKSEN